MKLAMAAARNNSSAGKKPRKPYKITRPREMWAADEHGRFLHALLLFGRDWKPVAQFVGTKTATQVRSHAQKHFLKAQKLGLGAALPPPKPRRGAVLAAHSPSSVRHDDNAVAGTAAAQMWWPTAATPRTMSCTDCAAPSGAAQQGASAGSRHWPSRSGGEPGGAGSAAGAMAQEDETMIQLPLSPGVQVRRRRLRLRRGAAGRGGAAAAGGRGSCRRRRDLAGAKEPRGQPIC
ncbi:hypothetical protein GQ55_3G122900 [Panicum hallii var. hallii]|uniref:Uncharacterized protein n=1 Tax=Panicum hallii var. hallii TaxID=1504633 RepID=A0A2T7E8M5_9POAL|nr:hypothetical protein GQ55_3G122900 [Panicum hallii var. hallii]